VDAAFVTTVVILFNEVLSAPCGSVRWFIAKRWFRKSSEARFHSSKGRVSCPLGKAPGPSPLDTALPAGELNHY